MEKIVREADLPFSCREVFNAVAELERFPDIFPSIRSSTVLRQDQAGSDIELAFNVPYTLAAFLTRTSQDMRVTSTPDSEICLKSTAGALKSINIRWTFNEVSPGKTHVRFEMDYETGMHSAVNATVKIFINRNTKDILSNLDGHIRKKISAPKKP